MKNLILSLFILFRMCSYSQQADSTHHPKPNAPVYRVVEVMPQFPGGQDSLNSFITTNLKYPRSARENSISGKVVIECIVDTDGSLTDIKVKTSVHPKLDDEALRIIKLMPKFKPGSQKGNAVKVIISLPVNFKLS